MPMISCIPSNKCSLPSLLLEDVSDAGEFLLYKIKTKDIFTCIQGHFSFYSQHLRKHSSSIQRCHWPSSRSHYFLLKSPQHLNGCRFYFRSILSPAGLISKLGVLDLLLPCSSPPPPPQCCSSVQARTRQQWDLCRP